MAVPMNFVTFNQDHSCLAVGTHSGYRIYNCDPFGKVYENKEGDVSIIEMLFSTSLVALIFSPRRLVITNTKVRLDVSSVCNKKKHPLPASYSRGEEAGGACRLTWRAEPA